MSGWYGIQSFHSCALVGGVWLFLDSVGVIMGTFEPICKAFMSSIGARLREERERLGWNQTELASIGGTTRKTQFNYETGARKPDSEYLAAAASAGVDVLYVLTGEKGEGLASSLDAAEQVLLDCYRRCSAQARQNLIQTAALLSAGLSADPSVRSAAAHAVGPMRNTGVGAVQVGSAGGKVVIKKGG